MSAQTPSPIAAPTVRFAIGFAIGLCLLAAVLWLAAT